MATRTRRSEWREVKGRWTRSLGERGFRVRLFQKRKNGTFYRVVWVPGRGRHHAPLGTRDRVTAEQLCRKLLSELLRDEQPDVSGTLSLGGLWRRYENECSTFLDNKLSSRRDTAHSAAVLIGFFGEGCDVREFTARDQAAFAKTRRVGGIVSSRGVRRGPVRDATIARDLYVLHTMLLWATTVRLPSGARLLDRHPLAGVRRDRERNPMRPVASWERFERTRAAMQALANSSKSERNKVRWAKLEFALVLAEATGRRLGSIRGLCWEDVDCDRGTIHWQAKFDKRGQEWVVPVGPGLVRELKEFRRTLSAISGWVFSSERDPSKPMDRHLFDKWLVFAEKQAGLPKLRGGVWHPYRRKWATERKHHALADVAAAGGWKDRETLLNCYQQPDAETLLAVMSETRKVRDVMLASR